MARTLIRPEQYSAVRFFDRHRLAILILGVQWCGNARTSLHDDQLDRADDVFAYWRARAEQWGEAVFMADFDVDAVTLLSRLS